MVVPIFLPWRHSQAIWIETITLLVLRPLPVNPCYVFKRKDNDVNSHNGYSFALELWTTPDSLQSSFSFIPSSGLSARRWSRLLWFCRHCRMWSACLHRGEARLGPTQDIELVINGTGFSNPCSPLLARGLSNSNRSLLLALSTHSEQASPHCPFWRSCLCICSPEHHRLTFSLPFSLSLARNPTRMSRFWPSKFS